MCATPDQPTMWDCSVVLICAFSKSGSVYFGMRDPSSQAKLTLSYGSTSYKYIQLSCMHSTDAADVCCMLATAAHILRYKHRPCQLPLITCRFPVCLCEGTGEKMISNGEVVCFASVVHQHICKIQKYP
jgi:hypothetical protein